MAKSPLRPLFFFPFLLLLSISSLHGGAQIRRPPCNPLRRVRLHSKRPPRARRHWNRPLRRRRSPASFIPLQARVLPLHPRRLVPGSPAARGRRDHLRSPIPPRQDRLHPRQARRRICLLVHRIQSERLRPIHPPLCRLPRRRPRLHDRPVGDVQPRPSGRRSYLSVGSAALPRIYSFLCLVYASLTAIWIAVLCHSSGAVVLRIHHFMLAVVVLKAVNLLCEAEDKSHVERTGGAHGWDVLFYAFSLLKGVTLFTLIGTGWSFILHSRDKRVLMVVYCSRWSPTRPGGARRVSTDVWAQVLIDPSW